MSHFVSQLVAIGFLCRKEFLALFKERASRIILFAPVLMQALLYGYGATYDLTYAPYAVLDQSRSAASTALLARVEGSGVFQRQATLANATQIAPVIDSGQALLVLHIPADFEARLASGQAAPVQVILDGRNSTTANAAAAQVNATVAAFNQARMGAPAIRVERRAWFNPNLESRWNLMPALIAALSLIQTLLLSSLTVAREREQGTFDQLLVTPLTPIQILIGKAIPPVLVGVVQAAIIWLIIRFWFQIPMAGDLWVLFLGVFVFTCASVGLGLSISALSLNMQQAMLYAFLLTMPLMLLSGLLTPVSNMPELLQLITYANPLRFGMDLVRRVYLEGAGLSEIAFDFVPMLVMAMVTLPLAAWLFRHRLA